MVMYTFATSQDLNHKQAIDLPCNSIHQCKTRPWEGAMTFFPGRTTFPLFLRAPLTSHLAFRAFQKDNKTVFTFTRNLDTGDNWDHVIPLGPINIIFAYGSPGHNKFGYHGNNKGSKCLDLSTGLSCSIPLSKIKLPPGFGIELFAQVPNARQLALSDDGMVLFVGSWEGNVYALNVTTPWKVWTETTLGKIIIH